MDIVERLRAREHCDTWNGEFVSKEAADEIDRLREALRDVLAKEYVADCKDVARAALKEGE